MQHKYWISIVFFGLGPDFHYTNFFGDLFEKVGFKLICNIKNAHHQRKMWVLSLYATQKLHFERFFSLAPDFHYTNFIGDIFSKKVCQNGTDIIEKNGPKTDPGAPAKSFKNQPKIVPSRYQKWSNIRLKRRQLMLKSTGMYYIYIMLRAMRLN